MTRRDDDELPLSRRKPLDEDVRRELEFHLDRRAEEFEADGMAATSAREAARAAFGDRSTLEAECREIERRHRAARRRAERIGALRQDLVFGLRMLRKSPGFTAAAVVTLALGVGANTGVFSIVNQVLLRPLPYVEPDRLVTVVERHENGGWGNLPWSNFLDLEANARSLTAIACYGAGTITVLGSGEPLRVKAGWVTSGFFHVFPVTPTLGRLPAPDEHKRGANPVAVVSHRFWRTHLGGAPSLEGLHLRMSLDHVVIGVLPPTFDFADTDIWRPMELLEQSLSRTSHNWETVARLAPGVRPTDATRELDDILARLKPVHYPDFDAIGSLVTPLQKQLTGSLASPLYLLLGASGLLLLAACANVASAMLARGTSRGQELAIRSALGAGRMRLIRQLFTEGLLLAALGCAAGVIVALVLIRSLTGLAPAGLGLRDIRLDGWVLAFAIVVSLGTAVLFALLPALRISSAGSADALREGAGGGVSRGRLRLWNALVVGEVAVAVVLLAGSALFIRSFAAVTRLPLGFETGDILTMTVNLPTINYADTSSRVARFHDRAIEEIARIPGVEAVGMTNVLPLQGTFPNGAMEVEGKQHDPRGPFTGYSIYRIASGAYFRTLGIPLLRGRVFGPEDAAGAPRVVIVNQSFADQEWPGEDPIGKRLRPAGMDANSDTQAPEPWSTVIGVVGDVRHADVIAPFRPAYYFDYRQRPAYRSRNPTYVLRVTGIIGGPLRETLRKLDPEVPIELGSMSELVDTTVSDRSFTTVLLGSFAGIALILATVGVHGVVSYAVARRTREIGVRLALGAEPGQVRRLVQGNAMRVVAIGLATGAVAAVGLAYLVRRLLFDVSPADPSAFLSALAALGGAAWLASLLPARRATRVDPMIAIRAE